MKLALYFILTCHTLNAQQVVVGETDYSANIYSIPFDEPLFANKAYVIGTIPPNAKVYCIQRIDTSRGMSKYVWYKSVYKHFVGYVSGNAIRFRDEQIVLAKDLPKSGLGDVDKVIKMAMDEYKADSVKAIEIQREESRQRQIEQMESKKRELADSLERVKKMKNIVKLGFAVIELKYRVSDYGFVDFTIGVMNFTPKTVKYIWVTVTAYNPVDDPIDTKTVKIVGPMDFQEDGTSTFENLFYTKVFDYGRLKKIKVQFMDGSIKEFQGSSLEGILYLF